MFPVNINDSVNTYLSVINVPDSSGIGCEFALNSLYLNGGRTYLGLPNMPNYNLGRLIGSPCDTLQTVSLEENKNENLINIFPNPSSGIFEITFQKNQFIKLPLLIFQFILLMVY